MYSQVGTGTPLTNIIPTKNRTGFLPPCRSKSTEEREELDGDKENLLEGEIPPGMELPETFPVSLRNLDTDPFLRIQVGTLLTSSVDTGSVFSGYTVYLPFRTT